MENGVEKGPVDAVGGDGVEEGLADMSVDMCSDDVTRAAYVQDIPRCMDTSNIIHGGICMSPW